jgi:FkbM family methyltransferase
MKTATRKAIRRLLGKAPPKFAGTNPGHSEWLAEQIWGGEYDEPGFVPARGWRVLDVGANVGTYAVLSAKRKAQVVAYEPHPETYGYLVHNAISWGVDCRQAAIVAEQPEGGTVALFLGSEDTRHSLLRADQGSGAGLAGDSVAVRAVTARQALSGRWDLVKIDCEGVEFDLLDSLTSEDIRGVHRLIVELHGDEERRRRFVERLEREGFTTTTRDLPEPLLALCFATRG